MNGGVHIFFSTVGFFDFQSIKCFSVDNADNFIVSISDGEVGKTRFVEFVEYEGTEYFLVFDKDKIVFGCH